MLPGVGDADEAPAVVAGVPVAEGGDEAELLWQALVEGPPESKQNNVLQLKICNKEEESKKKGAVEVELAVEIFISREKNTI